MIQSLLPAEAGPARGDYRLAPDVLFLRIQDGSARLLDLGGNFYAISQTGAQMLHQALTMGRATAAASIATQYRVEVSRIHNDLHTLLCTLEKKRLIVRTRTRRRAIGRQGRIASLLLVPLLRGLWLVPALHKPCILLTIAHLALRFSGWPGTAACWQAYFRSAPVHTPVRCGAEALEHILQEIDHAVCRGAVHHLLPVACKERALACWWLLHAAGVAAQLVVGVNCFPLECHCWCEVGPSILSDAQERCQQFTPLLWYGNGPVEQSASGLPSREGLCR